MAENPSADIKHKMLVLLDNFGKASTFFIGLLLCLSVFYDYNFFRALRLTFADVPTTITDHLRSAIVWLPSTVLAFFTTALFALLMRVFAGTWVIAGIGIVSEKDLEGFSSSEHTPPENKPAVRHPFAKLVGINVLLFLFLFSSKVIVGVVEWDVLYDYFVPTWLVFSLWFIKRARSFAHTYRIGNLGLASFVVIPITVALIGEAGYSDGREMTHTHRWGLGREIIVKNEDESTQTCQALGVRRFTSAVIVVGPDGKVTVMPPERLLQVRVVYDVEFDSDISCPVELEEADEVEGDEKPDGAENEDRADEEEGTEEKKKAGSEKNAEE